MHQDSTGHTMNQVMRPFQQWFGKPCLCWATLSVWEKVCLCRGIWRILLGGVDHYSIGDLYCGFHFHWTITTQVHAETISGTWSTIFEHVWPQEGPSDEVILDIVCNWTQRWWHETRSQSMCFVVGMISGSLVTWKSSLFRWKCSLLQLPILQCFSGARQNP